MLAGTKQTWDIFPIITESENEGGTKQESDLEVEPVKLKSNSISKFTVFSEILSSMHSLGNNWKFPNLLSYFFFYYGLWYWMVHLFWWVSTICNPFDI